MLPPTVGGACEAAAAGNGRRWELHLGERSVSHIVTIKTEIRDVEAIRAACGRLKLAEPQQGVFRLFAGEATGIGVQLPGWQYPVVCNVATGQVQFDHFQGRWGDPVHLDKLLQAYAVEKAKLEARRRGHTVMEQTLADGSIRLAIQVQGGAA